MVVLLLLCGTGHAQEAADRHEVPLEVVGSVPFVRGSINGRSTVTLIVDTGATATIITPRTARDTGLRMTRSPHGEKTRLASLEVGNVRVSDLEAYVLDPPQALSLRLDKGINYQGILGYTFLSRCVLTIDYPTGKAWFTPLAMYRSPGGDGDKAPVRVPFTLKNRLVYVDGRMNGEGPFAFVVDTGSAEVVVRPHLAAKLGLDTRPVAGYEETQFAEVEELAMGSATVADVPVIVTELPLSGGRAPAYDAIVGHPFLSHFVVTVDYGSRSLLLGAAEAAP